MVSLPTQKSQPDLKYSSQKIAVLGISGIGKSHFFAQDDKALFLEAEKGLNHLSIMKIPVRNWEDLRDVYASLKELEKKGEFPYNIIVIDTIDRIVDFAEEEIVSRAKEFYAKIANEINTISDVPNGAGWSKTRSIVMNFLEKLDELPCAIAFISHLTIKRIEDGVRKYDKSTISVWSSLGNDLLAWCDHILNIEANLIGDKLKRTVWTWPTQSRECKSRGGIVPNGWVWEGGNTKEEEEACMKVNYQNFRKLFT